MTNAKEDKNYKSGGCFSLIVFLFIIIKLASIDPKPQEIIAEVKAVGDVNTDKIIQTNYNWSFISSNLQKKSVSLSINILENDVKEAMNTLESLYYLTDRELNLSYNYSTHPLESANEYWGAIYKQIIYKTGPKVDMLANELYDIAIKNSLNKDDLLYLCFTMVQNIKYKIPEERLGIIPPIVSIAREYADCDTASVLLYSILDGLGYDMVLYYSMFYSHAMIGINTSGSGMYKLVNNKPYYFLELTNPGWDIGQISADMSDLEHWYPIEL